MVTIHSQSRRPSNTGSMGHSSSRTRRRSSLRRQSEKSAPTVAASVIARNNAQQKRTRSVSTGASQQNQPQQLRRPSAPAVVEMPRLSIADRFMTLNYSSNPPPPPPPPPPPSPPPQSTLQPQQQQSGSLSISTGSNSNLHLPNSALSEIPTAGSNNKLSVADRFMSSSNKNDVDSPTQSNLNTQQQYRERSGSAYSARTKSSGTIEPSFSSSSDPVPGRLTIASAFMKSASNTPDAGRSRTASFADDLDMGASTSRATSGSRKPSQVHPLETPQSKSILFDDTATSYLNLDLNIASPSTSSSVLNHFDSVRTSRPWGSQDTLVHPHMEKKKPIYAQFIDSEKDATIDHRSFSLGGYFLDAHAENKHETRTNDDRYLNHPGYEDGEDVELEGRYQKSGKYDQHERHSYYEDEDEEKRSYYRDHHDKSPANSTAKLNHKKKFDNSLYSVDEEDEKSRGFWVGCCFISCGGKKPSRRVIEEHQKQRRKKEIEQQQQESTPKNKGFGRRGWVFCTFLSLIVIVLIAYLLWPRTPLIRIEGASLTSPAKVTETRHGVMVGNVAFESEWLVNITVDNRQNRVPTRLVQVQILAKDALTGLVIGKGLHNDDSNPEHIVLAPNAISTIPIPIKVDYQARESTDTTFVNLNRACAPQQSISSNTSGSADKNTNQREALPLHFWITLHFFGLDWLNYKPTVIATPATGGFACPQS